MVTVDTGKQVTLERQKKAIHAFRDAGDRGLTRKQIAKAIGLELRAEHRVRKALLASGASFDERFDPVSRGKVFIMRRGPRWDESVSKVTRLALRVAALALGHGGNATLAKQLETLEAITDKNLTDKDRKIFERLRKNISVTGGVAELPPDGRLEILETVFQSFSAEFPRQLELEYRKAGGTAYRTIVFSPYCLTQDLISGGTYVLGQEAGKARVMQLRISRIRSAKVLGRPAIFLKSADLERAAEHQIGGWVNPSEPFEVTLRIQGTHWIESLEEAHPDFPDFSMDKRGDHAFVRFRANAPEGLIRWILQIGPGAEVLGPDKLRLLVKQAIDEMSNLYR